MDLLLLQGVLGQSAAEAGAVVLAMPLAMAVASQLGGRVADRVGPRTAATVGGVLILGRWPAAGPLDPRWNGPEVTWRLALLGLGSGFFAGPNLSAIMTATPRSLIGTVSAVSALGRTLGFTLGPAIAVGLCRSIQLLVLLARGDTAKDLEILVLRQQLTVLRCQVPGQPGRRHLGAGHRGGRAWHPADPGHPASALLVSSSLRPVPMVSR